MRFIQALLRGRVRLPCHAHVELPDAGAQLDDLPRRIPAQHRWEFDRHERLHNAAAELPVDGVEAGGGYLHLDLDKVMGMVQHGYAEFLTAPASGFTAVPSGLDLRDAAAIPVVALTGTQLIEETANVQSGQTVLVTGALGGVGRFAVYAARARGAKVIAGVRTKQLAEAQKLGASSVVALDDDAAIAGLPPLDAVADTVGGPTQAKVTSKVKNGGVVASTVGPPPGDSARGVMGKGMQARPDGKRLAGLANAVKAGEVQVPIAKRFPLAEAAKAHRFAEAGGVGKVLLTV
jgi:NADPH:quinone reductase-like Zn-dependent oxidoreductase